MADMYDVIIIGAGPAGLTAGIYCGRAGLKTLIMEKIAVGGQILKADIVENYPAFPDGISGFDLMEKMRNQAEKFGAKFISAEASELNTHLGAEHPEHKHLGARQYPILNTITSDNSSYSSKAIIIATGADPKKLGIKGETELTGRGVSYCATCDGPLFKGKDMIVIGGGDAAVGEALYLVRFAKKLTLVHRRDNLRASKILQDRLLNTKNAGIKWSCVPIEILGRDKVSGIRIKNVKTNNEEEIPASGVFIYVGLVPNTGFLKGKINLDEKDFVITDENLETSTKGIFACGDVRKNTLKQVVVACAEGAQAAYAVLHYLEGL